ncbi:hypothetical protein C5S39_04165 [Candidatus Methanophagaceae archaeon]|nr:hypothetical protein C5S39_04165 [Methanophagales archaeon]
MNVLIEYVKPRDFDTLVVIGDGTPDDIAVSIIAFHSEADKIVGIVKPPGITGLGVIDLIPRYLKGNIHKILVLLDQEDNILSEIHEILQKRLQKVATRELEIIEEKTEKRLRVYNGKYGGKEFELILVINGLDEIRTDQHTIEDHLLKAAEMFSIDVGDFEKSKKAWQAIIPERQLKIFKELKAKRKLVGTIFPQQVEGCEYLKSKSVY